MAARKSDKTALAKFPGALLLVGAGKMGSAMLDGWLARGLAPKRIATIEPQPGKSMKALTKRGLKLNPKGKATAAAAIVIAVKPQTAPAAVPPLAAYVDKSTLVLSIMAGRTIGFLEKSLPGAAIVRAMPNTPAAIGRSISVAVANGKVSARQRKLATDLLAAIGKVEWVQDEALIDAVTALSGSGPAYVFLLAEAMTKAGIAAGLPAELAARLARETVAGSGELLHRSELDAATLRQNVTSPGGTTAAALEVLMGPGGFDELLTKAIAAATRRSRELAG
ncbi:MAG: pyrroline-5-carboxylate reductase [Rhizobiales bacterium]|nr:pyrroline-5-carboxylate reductase [Hyphomicrobiales bacterium]